MKVVHSNRLECLAEALADSIRSEPAGAFAREHIVVPSVNLENWLKLELCTRLGIAANLQFEQPAKFIWKLMRRAASTIPENRHYTPASMRWRIYEMLPGLVEEPVGAPLRSYYEAADKGALFQLADRIAHVLERYVSFRPDWIEDWEQHKFPTDETLRWQAVLWARLVRDDSQPGHWVSASKVYREAMADAARPQGWPERVSFFAVAHFTPLYLDILTAAGSKIAVNMYMHNPCREYWGDIYTEREIRRRVGEEPKPDLHHAEGNELLAGWGRFGRDSFDSLIERESRGMDGVFVEPEGESRLAHVQRDILDLKLGRSIDHSARPAVPPDDSIQVHVCHSVTREVEVLHDRLLALLEDDPDLVPSDILILTTDPYLYGPAIDAVFDAAAQIPVSVSRTSDVVSSTLRAFADLLALPLSRYGAEAVLRPLESAVFRQRYGMNETDLATARQWVHEAGIRWGVDAGHRAEENLEAKPHLTWKWGLQRLLMGYATGTESNLFAGVAPVVSYGVAGFDPDTELISLMGRFMTYCERVFALRTWAEEERPAAEWISALRKTYEDFVWEGEQVVPDDIRKGINALDRLIEELAAETNEVTGSLPYTAILDAVVGKIETRNPLAPRLADRAVAARLRAGEVYPARVLCVVGMDVGAFPRKPTAPMFDRVAHGEGARRGDQDQRSEDRFAFLEALLGARRSFIVTYIGRSQSNNELQTPSIPLKEFVAYLESRFDDDESVVEHPLQPFNPAYFGETSQKLFSYASSMRIAAENLVGRPLRAENRYRFRTEVPTEVSQQLSVAELRRFFRNPAKAFLRAATGSRIAIDRKSISDEDILILSGLERYNLFDYAMSRQLEGVGEQTLRQLLQERGILPWGLEGRDVLDAVVRTTQEIRKDRDNHLGGESAPVYVDVTIAGIRLIGKIEDYSTTNGAFLWRAGRKRAQEEIDMTLLRLLLAACGKPSDAVTYLFIEPKDGTVKPITQDKRLENPSGELLKWIEMWKAGQRQLLPFAPRSSIRLRDTLKKDGWDNFDMDRLREAMLSVRETWMEEGYRNHPEIHDASFALTLEDLDPLQLKDPVTQEFIEVVFKLLLPDAQGRPLLKRIEAWRSGVADECPAQ